MSKLVPQKPQNIIKILLQNGFTFNHSTGSHRQYFNPQTRAHVTVPFHAREIPVGTLRSIVRQSLLSIDLFRK